MARKPDTPLRRGWTTGACATAATRAALMGVDPADRAWVEMWNRRMELEVLSQIAGTFRNTHEFFKDVAERLTPHGVLCISLGHYENYLSDELAISLKQSAGHIVDGS